jgi:prepilin-type N-terminal cleavage/methylation domain-containing protein
MMSSKKRPSQKAFTLVELLVAMALGVILTGAIVFIFVQSSKIFTDMDAKVAVYNYARTAFDVVERDLSNTTKTADMEFFQDSETSGLPGHYDKRNGDPESIAVVGEDGKSHFLFDSTEKYIYAMTLHQPPEYKDFAGVKHRHDSIYFRTVTSIGGQTKPVLVEYSLDYKRKSDGSLRALPVLIRRHWTITKVDNTGLGGAPAISLNGNGGPLVGKNEPIVTELCLYVTDVKFEFYLQDKRSRALDGKLNAKGNARPGRFFSAEEACKGPQSGKQNELNIKMRNFASNGGFKIACFYDYRHLPTKQNDEGTYDRNTEMLVTKNEFHFPMSEVGDRVFIFDSDVKKLTARDLTIQSFAITSGTGPGGGKAKVGLRFNETLPSLDSDPTLKFRMGFLPSMIRMTVKIKDRKNKAVRTMVRQFKLLGA